MCARRRCSAQQRRGLPVPAPDILHVAIVGVCLQVHMRIGREDADSMRVRQGEVGGTPIYWAKGLVETVDSPSLSSLNLCCIFSLVSLFCSLSLSVPLLFYSIFVSRQVHRMIKPSKTHKGLWEGISSSSHLFYFETILENWLGAQAVQFSYNLFA